MPEWCLRSSADNGTIELDVRHGTISCTMYRSITKSCKCITHRHTHTRACITRTTHTWTWTHTHTHTHEHMHTETSTYMHRHACACMDKHLFAVTPVSTLCILERLALEKSNFTTNM